MKKYSIIAAAAVLGLSTTAFAQNDRDDDEQRAAETQSQNEDDAEEEELDPMQEVVCRTEPILGSRTRVTRTCMTRQEWNYTRERARREVDNISRNAGTIRTE